MKTDELGSLLRQVNRPKKIAVCTAWGSPFSWTHAAYNMMNLERPKGVEVKYIPGFGRDPGRRHTWGVEKALEWGASHVCFLGADQMHDLDILVKFCKHIEDGWPMVTALVPIRSWVNYKGADKPFMRLAWKWKESAIQNGLTDAKFHADYLDIIDPKDGDLQEAVVVGSGALIFDMALINALEKPWFREAEPDENGWKPATMDTTFCWRLVREVGGRMLADCSIKVVHLDVFPIDETFSERFADFPRELEKEKLRTYL